MSTREGPLYFLSHMRRGAGQYRTANGTVAAAMSFEADGQDHDVDQELTLMGPQHVTGISQSQVLRNVPAAGSRGFEPNLFAAVEFSLPDLPWMFSPEGVDAAGQLKPWLVLVVVEDRTGVRLSRGVARNGAPGLDELTVGAPLELSRQLPNLSESWAWAHVQAAADLSATSAADAFTATPEDFRARLICPRRLEPHRDYFACVVPAYQGGVTAGLGMAESPNPHEPAWSDTQSSVTLPVYHSWRFATGARGDFEALVRRLEPVELDAGAADLDLTDPGDTRLLTAENVGAEFRGAIIGAAVGKEKWDKDHQTAWVEGMAKILATYEAKSSGPQRYDALTDDPVVAPPLWGGQKIGETTAPDPAKRPSGDEDPWFSAINYIPKHRAAAGLGAEVVRRNQEDLMAEAWAQVEGLREVNRAFNQTRLAAETGKQLKSRKIDPLEDSAALSLSTPAAQRIPLGAGVLRDQMGGEAYPSGLGATTFARMTRRRSVVGRKTEVTSHVAEATVSFFAENPTAALQFSDILEPSGISAGDYTLSFDLPTATPAMKREQQTAVSMGIAALRPLGGATLSAGAFASAAKRRVSFSLAQSALLGTGGAKGKAASSSEVLTAARGALDPVPMLAARLKAKVRAPAQVFARVEFPARHLVEPRLDRTGYRLLRGISADAVMPGISALDLNSVGLATVNAAFVEAFLVGANAELAREFLWREYPGRLNGTYLRRFWDTPEAEDDIGAISSWKTRVLGKHQIGPASDGTTIVVIKAEVFARYPEMEVYASRAAWDDRGFRFEPRHNGEPLEAAEPSFGGWLDRQTAFLAFDLRIDDMRGTTEFMGPDAGWFIVFEQARTGIQFGFDVVGPDRMANPRLWQDVDWGHALDPSDGTGAATHLTVGAAPISGNKVLAEGQSGRAEWGTSASAQAQITLQRPMRVLMHASGMLP